MLKQKSVPIAGREMLLRAVPRKVGEYVKEYVSRASKEIPLGYAITEQLWKNGRYSRKTAAIIEAKVKNNENDLSSRTQRIVEFAEDAAAVAVALGRDAEVCGALRRLGEFARTVHREVEQSADGGKVVKIAFVLAVAAAAFFAALPPAYSQYYPGDYGVRYPRPPGGGTRPRPRPRPVPEQPQPEQPAPPPPPSKPPAYWGGRY